MATKQSVSLDSLLVRKPGYRDGRPCLKGTGITVHNVAVRYLQGGTVEEMCAANPDLDPSLFHAALAYYFANRGEIEADFERDRILDDELREKYPNGIGPDTPRPW